MAAGWIRIRWNERLLATQRRLLIVLVLMSTCCVCVVVWRTGSQETEWSLLMFTMLNVLLTLPPSNSSSHPDSAVYR